MSNLSQQKRAEMLKYLHHLKEIHTDDESRIALEKIETALTEKKYGLVWEEHEEEVDKKLVHNIPVFREVEDKKIVADENGDFNFLLEGDNLHSLKLLEKTHKGRIDVIYIDPPYNTKNKEFIYNDTRIGEDDTYRHSKWLSFMAERLKIALKLLSKDGAIFINIDDNEHAQLKLLCDNILGEQNFLTSIPWHNRTSKQNDTDISVNHEYILVYAKYKRIDNRRLKDSNRDKWEELKGFTFLSKLTDKTKFSNPDNDPRGLWKADPFDAPNIRPNLTYPIVNPNTGKQHLPPRGRHWRMSQDRFASALADNRIVFGKSGKARPQLKVFYDEVKFKGVVADTWFDSNIFGTSTEGKKELLKLLPDTKNVFSTPKPTKLYIELMKISLKNIDGIVLDFFAGSGTTGQAVMQLNKEDGGNRKFILCTNNENGIAEDVCYKRIEKVIKGYKYTSRKKEIEVEGIPHNLKYYKTEFIPKLSKEEDILSSKLLGYIKEMVALENMCEVDGVNRRIILSDDDLRLALNDMKEYGSLYIPSFILLTNQVKSKLDEKKIEVITIPDYYFTEELREANEL